jgi:PIN domain nuclease of toxin-antitoxin system
MNYLADTQVLIWALVSPTHINLAARMVLETSDIWVSQVSLFEIAIKQKIGKLPEFSLSTEQLINQLHADGFQIIPIQNTHIAAYNEIPLVADHRDPFDRLILATAFVEKMPIISADNRFRDYVPMIRLVEA